MALNRKINSLEEVDEALRGHYNETNDGSFVLDISGLEPSKSDADVERLQKALESERAAHKLTKDKYKSKIEAYDVLGDIDDIQERLDEAEQLRDNGGKVSNAEILKLKKELRAKEKEFNAYKEANEPKLSEFEKLQTQVLRSEIAKDLNKHTATLKDVDTKRLDMYLSDEIDYGKLKRDELGDIVTANGEPIDEHINKVVELYGFRKSNTPSITPSYGGDAKVKQADALEKAKQKGDIIGLVANAPSIVEQ